MGIVICKNDIKWDGWRDRILSLFDRINRLLEAVPNSQNVIINKLSSLDDNEFVPFWDWDKKTNDSNILNEAIDSMFSSERMELSKICMKCGKNKGEPPSLTVRPKICEECRSKIVPSDYENNAIICMSGKAGSGKDTVADYLVEKYGFKRMAFADPLRDVVQLVFVMDHDNVWDRGLRELPLKNLPNYVDLERIFSSDLISSKTKSEVLEKLNNKNLEENQYWSVRKLLQFIGTEMFRNMINRDTWVMNFVQRLEPGINYVITDCRFPNELDWVKTRFGGKVVFTEVIRSGYDGKGVGIENHESERYKLPADAIIENNGTLEDLYHKVEKLMSDILKK